MRDAMQILNDQADEVYRQRRRARYALRERFQGFSSLARVNYCGRSLVDSEGGVRVHLAAGVGHFSNLQTCASVHSCTVCAPKIRHGRAGEVEVAASAHLAAGGGLEFVTVTLPHDQGDRLAALLAAVSKAWTGVTSGRARAVLDGLGLVGTVRALEVNHGANGWHPHFHVLFFFARPLTKDERSKLRRHVHERWSRRVVKLGYRAPSWRFGTNVRKITTAEGIGQYSTKVVGLELARHDLKRARRERAGYRTAWAVLADAVQWGDVDDLALWHEYEKATKGKRALVWSRGLKARFGVGVVSDEELAAEEAPAELVCIIPRTTWSAIVKRRLRALVLYGLESEGADWLHEWLARFEEDLYPARV